VDVRECPISSMIIDFFVQSLSVLIR